MRKTNKYKYNVVYVAISLVNYQMYIGSKSFNDPLVFKKYKTSSSIKDFVNSPKMKIVLGCFNTREEAIELEVALHKLLNVGKNKSFENKAKQTSRKFDRTGCKNSAHQLKKQSIRMSGKRNPNYKGKLNKHFVQGKNNHFLGEKTYWLNYLTGKRKHCYLFELVKEYNLTRQCLGDVKTCRSYHHKGWILDPKYNNTLFSQKNKWFNTSTKQTYECYLYEMKLNHNCAIQGLGRILRGNSTKYKNWTLIS